MSDWRSRLREGREDPRDSLRDTLRDPGRDSLRDSAGGRSEAEDAKTVGALINESVRKLVTAIVVAGGLIGLGAYASSTRVEAPDYQVTTTSDGRIVRLNTNSGSIVVCQDNRCWVMQRGRDVDDDAGPPPRVEPPKQEARPALPAPAQGQDNQAAAPAPAATPAPAPAPAAER